jgi:archaellum component FlaC
MKTLNSSMLLILLLSSNAVNTLKVASFSDRPTSLESDDCPFPKRDRMMRSARNSDDRQIRFRPTLDHIQQAQQVQYVPIIITMPEQGCQVPKVTQGNPVDVNKILDFALEHGVITTPQAADDCQLPHFDDASVILPQVPGDIPEQRIYSPDDPLFIPAPEERPQVYEERPQVYEGSAVAPVYSSQEPVYNEEPEYFPEESVYAPDEHSDDGAVEVDYSLEEAYEEKSILDSIVEHMDPEEIQAAVDEYHEDHPQGEIFIPEPEEPIAEEHYPGHPEWDHFPEEPIIEPISDSIPLDQQIPDLTAKDPVFVVPDAGANVEITETDDGVIHVHELHPEEYAEIAEGQPPADEPVFILPDNYDPVGPTVSINQAMDVQEEQQPTENVEIVVEEAAVEDSHAQEALVETQPAEEAAVEDAYVQEAPVETQSAENVEIQVVARPQVQFEDQELHDISFQGENLSDLSSSIQDQIDALKAKVEIVSDKVEVVQDHVETVSSDIQTVDAQVETVSSQVDTVENKVDNVENKVEDVQDEVETVQTQVGQVQSDIETVDTHVENVNDQVETVQDQIVSVDQQVDNVQVDIEVVQDQVENVQTDIAVVDANAENVQSNVDEIEKQIFDAEELTEEIQTDVHTVDDHASDIQAEVNLADTQADSLQSEVESVDSQVEQVQEQVHDVHEDLQSVQSAVGVEDTEQTYQS